MIRTSFRRRLAARPVALIAILAAAAVQPALAAPGSAMLNTPAYVASAQDQGAADPSQVIDVTLWLNLHARDQMDALARDLYTPASPHYRHWLTHASFVARFAPTAEEAQVVQDFATARGLHIVQVGADNFYVRVRGAIGQVEQAFQVSLHNFAVKGKILRANTRDPVITGAAAALVRGVEGLDSGAYEQTVLVRGAGGHAGKPAETQAVTASDAGFFNSACFTPAKERFSTNNDGQLPVATIAGNRLNLATDRSAGCGYTPAALYGAYDLTSLYSEGFTGAGQTIVIVDWCGSSTVQGDTNAFSRRFGLPLLTPDNFRVIYTPPHSQCVGVDQVEINLDVEWAHAIAPGANIDLVVPPTASFQDVDEGLFTAVNDGLGNAISGSFGSVEGQTPTTVLDTENLIAEMAAVEGMSANFSSGDDGDNAQGGPQMVNAPADSPWATGVGGVSLALNASGSIAWQAGWGTNYALLAGEGTIFDPPFSGFFEFGAGGGPSTCVTQTTAGTCTGGFGKPSFQARLPGTQRLVPDVSWLADPETGAVIAITIPDHSPAVVWESVGGTSLAAPMFSALWAIANEEAGLPLGQAAQYLYAMPRGAVTDIVPQTSTSNVVETVREPGQVNSYNARQVVGGSTPATPPKFISAFWNELQIPQIEVLTFGTDCWVSSFGSTPCNASQALHTALGWDDVTGVGVPDGKMFADHFRSSFVSPEAQ
jgi:subtilase family serine protease